MLKLMRKHARYFYVLFILVILSFIFWGVGTVDQSTALPVVEVGDEKISVDEYWRTFDRMSDLYREVYAEKFDEEMQKKLKEKVLDSLVDERVLLLAAQKAGIKVSDAELEEAITNDSTFMRDGAFNREVYLRTLELNRITPNQFEASKRRELIVDKMVKMIEESVDLTPVEAETLDEGLKEQYLKAKKQAATRSYVDGLKKQFDIKINSDLIS